MGQGCGELKPGPAAALLGLGLPGLMWSRGLGVGRDRQGWRCPQGALLLYAQLYCWEDLQHLCEEIVEVAEELV